MSFRQSPIHVGTALSRRSRHFASALRLPDVHPVSWPTKRSQTSSAGAFFALASARQLSHGPSCASPAGTSAYNPKGAYFEIKVDGGVRTTATCARRRSRQRGTCTLRAAAPANGQKPSSTTSAWRTNQIELALRATSPAAPPSAHGYGRASTQVVSRRTMEFVSKNICGGQIASERWQGSSHSHRITAG